MKRWIAFVACLAFVAGAFADEKSDYESLLKQGRYEELQEHLAAWERKEPENPEMFIGWFNYHIALGQKAGVSIDRERKGDGPTLEITNPETGEVVGYMNDSVQYDPGEIGKAFGYIDRGLGYSPDRLDMHFGKIHLLCQIEDYKTAGKALEAVFDRAALNACRWLWSDNEAIEDGKDFFLGNIQDYYRTWLQAGTDDSETAFLSCNLRQIREFPDNAYACNNVAVFYASKDDFPKALEYFLQAAERNPEDCIVIINIGLVYLKLDDKAKAKEQFATAVRIGNEQEREYARKILDTL